MVKESARRGSFDLTFLLSCVRTTQYENHMSAISIAVCSWDANLKCGKILQYSMRYQWEIFLTRSAMIFTIVARLSLVSLCYRCYRVWSAFRFLKRTQQYIGRWGEPSPWPDDEGQRYTMNESDFELRTPTLNSDSESEFRIPTPNSDSEIRFRHRTTIPTSTPTMSSDSELWLRLPL